MKLLPCPFCGEDKDLDKFDDAYEADYGNQLCVRCSNCGAQGPPCGTWEKAKKMWNYREENTR